MEQEPLNELLAELGQFCADDLLAKIGGLQLLPINAGRALRLELAAHAVAAAAPNKQGRIIRRSGLDMVLNQGVLGGPRFTTTEDPFPGLFTEAFTFVGRSYVIFPGILEEAAFAIRQIAKGLFLCNTPFPDRVFVIQAGRILLAVLLLSNEIARRAGLERAARPAEDGGKKVVVPWTATLTKLQQCVVFEEEDVKDLLGTMNLEAGILEPLIVEGGKVAMEECTQDSGPLQRRPIVRFDGKLVIAIPSMLLPAARHQILCQASQLGLLEVVAKRFRDAVWDTAIECLSFLDNPCLEAQWSEALPAENMSAGLFGLDTDKALYACLMTDDFSNYNENEVFGTWPLTVNGSDLDKHFLQVVDRLSGLPHPPNDVLFVLLTQSIGRWFCLGLQERSVQPLYALVPLSAAELETISYLEGSDSLVLWKFARASGNLRGSTNVLAFNTMDEFAGYRKGGYSYYLSDEGKPDALHFTPGFSAGLEIEVAEKFDPHGVPSHKPRLVTDVIALHGTRDVPIYAERASVGERVALLLEGYAVPIWIVGPTEETAADRANHRIISILADAIAYWLWQFTPSLRGWFDSSFAGFISLIIELRMTERLPERTSEIEAAAGKVPFTVLPKEDNGSIVVECGAAIVILMSGPDNRGERAFMEAILEGMNQIASVHSTRKGGSLDPHEIVERHAAPPHKKKIIILHEGGDTTLDRRGLPRYRAVQDSDVNCLLDEAGRHLTSDRGYQKGRIEDASRVRALGEIVDYYFGRLRNLVASLSPEGLLEWLVAHHEAVVYEEARCRLTLPTRLACFETRESLRKARLEEASDLAKAGVALRFVIEYVAAQPPRGIRPISLSVFDILQALAAEIVQTGFESDLIHLMLADDKLVILGSGRLGRGFGDYLAAQKRFMQAFTEAEIRGAPISFVRRWKWEAPSSPCEPEGMQEATRAEFGHSLSEVCTFMGAAINVAMEGAPVVCRVPENELVERLRSALLWPIAKVNDLIERLVLEPRNPFLPAAAPFRNDDVYPWCFNRDLSYLRRPFLRANAGSRYLLFGPRHLFQAGQYLARLCFEGRLQARHPEMKKVISAINNARGEAFNDEVADQLQDNEDLVVKRRVKKVGSLRGRAGPPGDIDVLVAHRRRHRLYLAECKDLALARTPRELANELVALFRGHENKKSTVMKHKERARWAQEHLNEVLTWLDVPFRGKWKVQPVLVFDYKPFSAYVEHSPVPVMSADEFVESLRQKRRAGR